MEITARSIRGAIRQAALALTMLAALQTAACLHIIGERELLLGGRPPGEEPAVASSIEVQVEPGTRLRGFVFAHPTARIAAIYFGGNNEWVTPASWIGPHGRKHGFDAYALNYRGYGPSDGTSSLEALLADSLKVFDSVAARPEVAGRPIVLYGNSLGTVAALHVAAHRRVAGVVLQAPPSDVAVNAPKTRRALPWYVRPFVRVRAAPQIARRKPQPIDLARSVTAPLLVIHGTRDRVIAPEFGRDIFEAAASREKSFCPVEGADHGTIWRDGDDTPRLCLDRFLAGLAARPGT